MRSTPSTRRLTRQPERAGGVGVSNSLQVGHSPTGFVNSISMAVLCRYLNMTVYSLGKRRTTVEDWIMAVSVGE